MFYKILMCVTTVFLALLVCIPMAVIIGLINMVFSFIDFWIGIVVSLNNILSASPTNVNPMQEDGGDIWTRNAERMAARKKVLDNSSKD